MTPYRYKFNRFQVRNSMDFVLVFVSCLHSLLVLEPRTVCSAVEGPAPAAAAAVWKILSSCFRCSQHAHARQQPRIPSDTLCSIAADVRATGVADLLPDRALDLAQRRPAQQSCACASAGSNRPLAAGKRRRWRWRGCRRRRRRRRRAAVPKRSRDHHRFARGCRCCMQAFG